MESRGWRDLIAGGGACLLAAAVLAYVYHWGVTPLAGMVNDDVVYLVLGKALATGAGYRSLDLPGAPLHVMYPPAYPALIGLAWAWTQDWAQLLGIVKALNVALATAGVFLLAALMHRRYGLPRWQAVWGGAALGFGTFHVTFVDLTMSELLFSATLLTALLVLDRERPEEAAERWPLLVCALALVAPAYVRTLGVVFLAVGCAWVVWRWPRWRGLRLAGLALALYAPWVAYTSWAGRLGSAGETYVAWTVNHTNGLAPLTLLRQAAENVPVALSSSLPLVVTPLATDARVLGLVGAWGLLPLSLVVLAGLVRWMKARRALAVCFLAGYAAIVLPFPWDPTRYTLALSAPLLVAFVMGATWPTAWARQGSKPARIAASGLVAALLLVSLAGMNRLGHVLKRPAGHETLMAEWQQAWVADHAAITRWAADHVPPDAIWMDPRAPLLYLLTGRAGFSHDEGAEPSPLTRQRLRTHQVYAVVPTGPPGANGYLAMRDRHPEKFELVFKAPRGSRWVYRLSRDW